MEYKKILVIVPAYNEEKSIRNVIEAIEDKNKKFFIGVQWHPESMYSYDILECNLFDYFIEVCRK